MYRSRPDLDEVKLLKSTSKFELDLKPITSLPFVSVVTITRNRFHLFSLPVHNWKSFKYPQDMIEWVIIDDSDNEEDLKKIISDLKDDRIRLHYLKNVLPIADKRNYSVKKCKGDIIVHMDDDDYYFPDSVLAKTRIFLDYPHKDVICSIPEGVHDLITERSAILDSAGDDIPENTMAYRKSYWKGNKFGNSHKSVGHSEWFKFIGSNWNKIINLPFWFNIISLTHHGNVTGDTRRVDVSGNNPPNFRKIWNREEKRLIDDLSRIVCTEKWRGGKRR